jgi:hypothetical protein
MSGLEPGSSTWVLCVFGRRSPGPASLPGHHENHLIWVNSSLMTPLELHLNTIMQSSLPAWLSKNYLIWVDSNLVVSPWTSCSLSPWVTLTFNCRMVSDYCILCIYCIWFPSATIIHSLCSSMIQFYTIRLFNYFCIQLLFYYFVHCSLFWSWKLSWSWRCIPGTLIH